MAVDFNGTGIVVYGITLPSGNLLPPVKTTALSFTLDGIQQSVFEFTPQPDDLDFTFNVPFFSRSDLTPGRHSLRATAIPDCFTIIDYVVVIGVAE
jgi:hypothetical protein